MLRKRTVGGTAALDGNMLERDRKRNLSTARSAIQNFPVGGSVAVHFLWFFTRELR